MARPAKDKEREELIDREIIVGAYGPEEQAIAWSPFLSDTLHFPFAARCAVLHATSPWELGEKVKVVEMASAEAYEHDMFVFIQWKRRQFAVPLIQLDGIEVGAETQQAIEDWHSWVNQGYKL